MNFLQHISLVLAVCLTLLCCCATPQAHNNRNIGFNAGTHYRNEFRGENGLIEGEYGFRTPDGCLHVVRYEATKQKYRVLGTSKRDCQKVVKKLAPKPKKPLVPLRRPLLKPQTVKKPLPRTTETRTTITQPTTAKPAKQTTRAPIPEQRSTEAPIPEQRPTTPRSTTTTATPTTTRRRIRTTPRSRPTTIKPPTSTTQTERAGKQLSEPVGPPPGMKRPRILSPDDPDPVYSFGYEAPGHGHVQAGLPDGSKKGEYFFDSPDGWRRFVTYEATENGFFPKMRQERIPDWENSALNPKNRFRSEKPGKQQGKKDGTKDGTEGSEGEQGANDDGDNKKEGKQLIPLSPPSNGCPYYFYTNTLINFHWERCLTNATRVGEYGKLGSDGYSHRVAYFADHRGYHPKIIKTPLTREQEESVAGFTEGAFIIPNIDEEKEETERRIQEWIAQNQGRIDNPI